MITEYLRVYTTQNFRNKQDFYDHGATRDNRWNQPTRRPQGNRALSLKLTVHYPLS
jgi:hypothetical protein